MEPLVIHVYNDRGTWMFDDRAHGMIREPLVFGMERLLDRLAATLPWDLSEGFALAISDRQLSDPSGTLMRQEEDAGGCWYYSRAYDLRGWMGMSGLLRYFGKAPDVLHYSARPAVSDSEASPASSAGQG